MDRKSCGKENSNAFVYMAGIIIAAATMVAVATGVKVAYTMGYFDAAESMVGASECKPLREIIKLHEMKS